MYNINLPCEIIDFLINYLTHKFRVTNMLIILMKFFKFIGDGGLQDIVKDNKNIANITQLHYDILKTIDSGSLFKI